MMDFSDPEMTDSQSGEDSSVIESPMADNLINYMTDLSTDSLNSNENGLSTDVSSTRKPLRRRPKGASPMAASSSWQPLGPYTHPHTNTSPCPHPPCDPETRVKLATTVPAACKLDAESRALGHMDV